MPHGGALTTPTHLGPPVPHALVHQEGVSQAGRAEEGPTRTPGPSLGGPGPHLSGHIGAVPIEVVVLPVEGDVVAAPVDGAGAVALGLRAGPASTLAGAGESRTGAWRGRRRPDVPPLRAPGAPHGPLPGHAACEPSPAPQRCPAPPFGPGPCRRGHGALWTLASSPGHAPLRVLGTRSAGPGHSPGVAVHLDLVPRGVQVLVVHTRALLLHDAAPTAVVHQSLGTHAAADALRLVLGAAGHWGSGVRGQAGAALGSHPLMSPPHPDHSPWSKP